MTTYSHMKDLLRLLSLIFVSMTQGVMFAAATNIQFWDVVIADTIGLSYPSHWSIWLQMPITVMAYSDIWKMDSILQIFYKTVLPSTCHTRNNHQQALRTILMNSSCNKNPLQRHSTSWDCVRQES